MIRQEARPLNKMAISLTISLIGNMPIIALQIYRWDWIDILTPFLMPLLDLLIAVIYLVAVIWSFIVLKRWFKRDWLYAVLPLSISLVTFLIVVFVPFTSIVLDRDFQLYEEERMRVVRIIDSGKLGFDKANNSVVELPDKYKHLSKGGGDVLVTKNEKVTTILFFTFRGVLDNYAGFIYRSDNKVPSNSDFGGELLEMKKLKPHWYWASFS